MNKTSKENMDRFISLFHKGEQLFVGFRDGWTHGYVSEIRESGFSLYQINSPTEYCYDWEHFEIICHPGIKVSQPSKLEVAELFEIQEKSYTPAWEQPLTKEPYIKSGNLSSQIITFPLDLSLMVNEITEVTQPERRYHEQYYNEAKIGGFKNISIKIGEGSGKFYALRTKEKATVIHKKGFSKIDTFLPIPLEEHEDRNYKKTRPSIEVERSGYFDRYIWDGESLESVRSTGWIKRPVYSGDPWKISDIIPVDLHTWNSKQGLLMVNSKASMWLGIIL
jgi:hypothetical protein